MYRLALAAFLGLALLGASAFDADAQNKSGKSSAPAVKSTAPVRQPAPVAKPAPARPIAPAKPAASTYSPAKPAAPKPANIAKPAAPKPAAAKPANIAKPAANTVKPGQGKTPVVGSNANRSGTLDGRTWQYIGGRWELVRDTNEDAPSSAKPAANTVKPGQGKTPVVGSNANRSGTIGGNSMTANTGKTPGTARPQTQKPASSDRIWGPRYGDDNRRLNPRPSKPLPAPYSPTNPEPGIQPSWGIDSLIPLMRFPLTRFSAPASAARTAPPARLPAPPASTIVGSRSTQMGVALGRSVNSDTVIGGRMYVGHALDRMMGRGVPPSVVENTIRVGQRFPGRTPDRTVFRDVRNSVQVIVETSSGRVITVE